MLNYNSHVLFTTSTRPHPVDFITVSKSLHHHSLSSAQLHHSPQIYPHFSAVFKNDYPLSSEERFQKDREAIQTRQEIRERIDEQPKEEETALSAKKASQRVQPSTPKHSSDQL